MTELTASPTPHTAWRHRPPHIPHAQRHWLTDRISLTLKLKAHAAQFEVIQLHQAAAPLHPSERIIAPPAYRQNRIVERDVLLLCDGLPVVLGHTITPAQHIQSHWPFFHRLGKKPLGLALFANPLISRLPLAYAELTARDTLYTRTAAALAQAGFDVPLPRVLYARRGLFTHAHHPTSRMMVSEVMLPTVYQLTRRAP